HQLYCSSTPTAPAVLSPLSLHDALPICDPSLPCNPCLVQPSRLRLYRWLAGGRGLAGDYPQGAIGAGSEPSIAATSGDRVRFYPDRKEHTSELQSRENLVCRLLLEKKKQ